MMYRSLIYYICWLCLSVKLSSALLEIPSPDLGGSHFSQTKDCTDLRNAFSSVYTNFSSCSLQYSYPIEICLRCDFHSLNETYSSLKSFGNGTCVKQFFQSSSVCIIDSLYNNMADLWKRSSCEACLSNRNDTKKFYKVWNELDDCLSSINMNDALDQRKFNCSNCGDLYKNLTQIFNDLTKKNPQMCLDIADAMNMTVHKWNNLECSTEFGKYIGTANIITTVFIAVLPFAFYTGVKLFSSIENVKLFYPKRRTFFQDVQR